MFVRACSFASLCGLASNIYTCTEDSLTSVSLCVLLRSVDMDNDDDNLPAKKIAGNCLYSARADGSK